MCKLTAAAARARVRADREGQECFVVGDRWGRHPEVWVASDDSVDGAMVTGSEILYSSAEGWYTTPRQWAGMCRQAGF